MIAFSNQ